MSTVPILERILVFAALLGVLVVMGYFRGWSLYEFENLNFRILKRYVMLLFPVVLNVLLFAAMYYFYEHVPNSDASLKIFPIFWERIIYLRICGLERVTALIFGFAEAFDKRKPYLRSLGFISLPYTFPFALLFLYGLPAVGGTLQKAIGVLFFALRRTLFLRDVTILQALGYLSGDMPAVLIESVLELFWFFCFFTTGFFAGHKCAKATDADKRWAEIQRKRQENEDKIENKLKSE